MLICRTRAKRKGMKSDEAWGGWQSHDPRVNRLSLARMFLFGARDVWFVVGVPVYFQSVLSDGTPEGRREAFFLIGGFLALWIIAYGAVQAFAPRLLGAKGQPEAETTRKAIRWAGLLVPIPFLLAGAAWAAKLLTSKAAATDRMVRFIVVFSHGKRTVRPLSPPSMC